MTPGIALFLGGCILCAGGKGANQFFGALFIFLSLLTH